MQFVNKIYITNRNLEKSYTKKEKTKTSVQLEKDPPVLQCLAKRKKKILTELLKLICKSVQVAK